MLLAFALACAGCITFCFARDRHLRQIWPQSSNSRQSAIYFRCGGTLLFCASTFVCCQLQGVATGLVSICGLLSVAVSLIALLLAYYPRGLLAVAWSTPVLVVLQLI